MAAKILVFVTITPPKLGMGKYDGYYFVICLVFLNSAKWLSISFET